ncbi:MAG: sigma-70 family RNA polymerase sigma factor [Chlamydiae bacterium]|nr:sigma-70 family RNA polymerase sigma factor [Chlamydiota bacterium]MBI3277486.1 sigma-70 family RNA polymerase sigma factor [Chlamydiota bacterium]
MLTPVSFERPLGHVPEESLILKSQSGDRASFEELIFRFQKEVYAIALKNLGDPDEAKDIEQEAFIQAFQDIKKIKGKSKFSTWLLGIVVKLCQRRRRWWTQRRKHIAISLNEPSDRNGGELVDKIADPGPSSLEEIVHAEAMRKVRNAIRTLDKPSRTAMFLRDVKGMSYDEICHVLGCRIGTVKSRLNRARLRVKNLVEK